MKRLNPNDYFGELSFLSGMVRSASARSCEYTRVLRLRKEEFLNCLKRSFCKDREIYFGLKHTMISSGNIVNCPIQCYSCYGFGHIARYCKDTH